MNKHEKFLEFNDKKIIFLSLDGTYWIALKSICEALNVDWNRSYQNVKNDPIFAPELAKQQIQVSKNGKTQLRNMICITEEFVYGWLCSLRSNNVDLSEYKRTCYKSLYNHFHGTITNRKELIFERRQIETEIFEVKKTLKEEEIKYKHLKTLEYKKKLISTKLNSMDNEIVKEPGFWG